MALNFVIKKMRSVINNQTIKNSHGFYLRNKGCDLARFNGNPIMLYQHDDNKPIGKWRDVKIEGDEMTAEPLFDDDAFSQEVKAKVENETLRGLSVGMIIKEAQWRENNATGEDELLVTQWELLEISIVSIPSNPKALIELKVYDNSKTEIKDIDKYVKLNFKKSKKMNELQLTAAVLVALGIGAETTSEAVNEAVLKLHKEKEDLVAKLQVLEAEKAKENKERITNLVELAIEKGKLSASVKEAWIKLGIDNPEMLNSTLSTLPERTSLGAMVQNSTSGHQYKKLSEVPATELKELRDNDKASYMKLYKAEYGVDCPAY